MREFDELKQFSENEKLNIKAYFDEMDLTDEEKEERKNFAKEMKDAFIFTFTIYLIMKQYAYMNKQYIMQQLQKKYSDIVLERIKIDDYLDGMINNSVNDIVDTTFRHDGEDYFTSDERATLIACNSANDILNYKQYEEAIKTGKKNKQWITEKDKRVRKTHKILDDIVIPINHTFLVGNTLMRFPHDTMYGTDYEQLSNCRCTIKYF